jgi:sulfite exporter TauE/SafE
MNFAYYISALTLGFLGSFHCAGMCGPIAMMLPKTSTTTASIVSGRLLYNSGRVLTYLITGFISGLLGLAIAMKGFQRELSIITGGIILLMLLLTAFGINKYRRLNASGIISWMVRNKLNKLFARKTRISLFLIGMLNGLLPCGFVYLAIAGAASAGTAAGGMTYMLLFGLGTFPVMMTISVAAGIFGLRFRRIFSKASLAVALFLGVFLIYRGTLMHTTDCHQGNAQAAVHCGP